MPVLFVHGVPATSRLWKPVMDRLDRSDMVAIDLPGFAAPPPAGWIADKDVYVGFIIDQLERLYAEGGPVHLVAHDFGCLLSLRAASLRPELLRSVAAGQGPLDEHWPLHSLWNIFARPGAGERFVDEMLTQDRIQQMLRDKKFDEQDARHNCWTVPGTKRLVMELYRSATTIGRDWSEGLRNIMVPSMLIWGLRDLVVPVEVGRRMANRMGAELVTLDADHFWPYERPDEVAAALTRLWDRAESQPYTIYTQDSRYQGILEALDDR